jgi:hypothetical protein
MFVHLLKPLSELLSSADYSDLHEAAAKVMRHLETKREAAERRRVVMMSQGISKFLEGTAEPLSTEQSITEQSITEHEDSQDETLESSGNTPVEVQVTHSTGTDLVLRSSQRGNETVLDKIRLTLDHAAEVLRESLELTAGGVVFLDTAISYTEVGDLTHSLKIEDDGRESPIEGGRLRPSLRPFGDTNGGSRQTVRSSDDQNKSTKVLAMSAAPIATWDHKSRVLDGKTLQMLINSYPKGNIWYIDDEGYFSSLEQINELATSAATSPSGRRRSVPTIDVTRQNTEATMLSKIFHKARQILFLPLWDAGGGT